MLRTIERASKNGLGAVLTLGAGGVRRARGPIPRDLRSVLVIRQHNQLGDMLCATPLLRGLRRTYPSSHITLITSPANHSIMAHHRHVDRVLEFRKLEGLGAFLRGLRDPRPDLAIVPSTVSTSFSSDLIALLSGAGRRLGCRALEGRQNPSAFCFTDTIDLDWRADPGRHQTLRNLDIASGLVEITEDLSIEITLTLPELEAGKSFVVKKIDRMSPVISIHPGAGKIPNRWPAERFARVAELLSAEFGAGILVTCGPMDEEPVSRMTGELAVPHTVVRGKSIREVAAILAAVSLVLSNDTGIMHVAAGVGTPVLSLFGPTDHRQWAPPGNRHRALHTPGGAIAAITVEEVLRTAREMLCAAGSGRRDFAS